MYVSKVVSTHRTEAHPEQPLPTGYNGIPFIVGNFGLAGCLGCAISVCVVTFLDCCFGKMFEFRTGFIFFLCGDDPNFMIFTFHPIFWVAKKKQHLET